MRYPNEIKEQVRSLRLRGSSLGEIYNQTRVPKTTIRLWIKDIILTKRQREKLKNNTQKALQEGRIKSQKYNKSLREAEEKEMFFLGEKQTKKLNSREQLLIGIALYWGEGFKNIHEHRLGFCNSDPKMIKFYLKWLKSIGVSINNIALRVTINSSYKEKTALIEKYWSEELGIPLQQFTKPFYQYSKWKKQYKSEQYYGVLRVHVNDSIKLLWTMKGWIAGLKNAKIDNAPG